MRNTLSSFALIVCIINMLTCKAFSETPAPPNTPGTPASANSSTVQKSDLDSLEQRLRKEIQSGTSETETQIAKLESLVTDLDQSQLDIADAIDNLEDKTGLAPIIVSAIAVCISAFAVFFGWHIQLRRIAIGRKNTLTTVNADRLKEWIEGLQGMLGEFMNVTYNVNRITFAANLEKKTPSGEELENLVQRADVLHNNLQIRLDPDREPHGALLQALDGLIKQQGPHVSLSKRRTDVLNAARRMFEHEWRRITDDDRP